MSNAAQDYATNATTKQDAMASINEGTAVLFVAAYGLALSFLLAVIVLLFVRDSILLYFVLIVLPQAFLALWIIFVGLGSYKLAITSFAFALFVTLTAFLVLFESGRSLARDFGSVATILDIFLFLVVLVTMGLSLMYVFTLVRYIGVLESRRGQNTDEDEQSAYEQQKKTDSVYTNDAAFEQTSGSLGVLLTDDGDDDADDADYVDGSKDVDKSTGHASDRQLRHRKKNQRLRV